MQATVSRKPRIRRGYNPGLYYVDSRSQPGQVHMVLTAQDGWCTCPGFRNRARCAHVSFCQSLERHLHAAERSAAS